MIDYENWNLLLLREYFNTAVSGEEVWLQASREELDAFGFHLGGAFGLIEAVRQGPSWANGSQDLVNILTRSRLFRIAKTKHNAYRDPGDEDVNYLAKNAPNYLPYLALFVLARTEKAFYAKVAEYTGRSFSSSDGREVMGAVWEDLERWSVTETGGEYGIFRARQLGGYRYVGLARSQALLTQKDRDGVHCSGQLI